MKVAIGSDHAGPELKALLQRELPELDWLDVGTFGPESVDYPDFAAAVAAIVAEGRAAFGVLICGTGLGMSMAANRLPGIRAAACGDLYSARMAREHNDANILCLGARVIGPGLAVELVKTFCGASFDGGERHRRRIEKMSEPETRATP